MLRFRKLRESDLTAFDLEHAELTGLLPSPAYYAETLAKGNLLLVILDGEKPLGLLEMAAEPVGDRPPCAWISRLLILPALRRHGLGRMLMALAAGEAAERRLWFIGGEIPDTEEAAAFADAVHMRPDSRFGGRVLLDLSDVEGLRHG